MSKHRLYLDMRLDLGFMGFYTILAKQAVERAEFDVINLHWYLFKWKGSFKLYKPFWREW